MLTQHDLRLILLTLPTLASRPDQDNQTRRPIHTQALQDWLAEARHEGLQEGEALTGATTSRIRALPRSNWKPWLA